MAKFPPASKGFVDSGVQLFNGVARFDAPSRMKFALPTPPVPLNARVLPEMDMDSNIGVVFSATEIIPAVFSALVFHFSPNGSGGSWTLRVTAELFPASAWNWQPEQEELAWKILQQFPAERSFLTVLERIYAASSNTSGLQKVYAAMMKYASPNAVAKNNFAAVSLLLNRQVSEAAEIAHANYDEHPEDGVIASTHAFALHLQGHTGDGLKVLEKLKEAELQKPAVATYYGVLLAADGQTDKAKAYLTIAAQSAQLLPEEKTLVAKAAANNCPSN